MLKKKKEKELRGKTEFYLCLYGEVNICQTINKLMYKISRCEDSGYCLGFTDYGGEDLKVVCQASHQLGAGFHEVRDPVMKKGNGTEIIWRGVRMEQDW